MFHFKKSTKRHSFLVTKILEGEELFINYGPNFFPTNAKEKEEEPKPTLLPSMYYDGHASDSTYSEEDLDLD